MAESHKSGVSPQLFVGGALLLVGIFLVIAIVLVVTRADTGDVVITNNAPIVGTVFLNEDTAYEEVDDAVKDRKSVV